MRQDRRLARGGARVVPGTETETKLFDSTNYLVQLKPDRLSRPEYSAFAGMCAEIQIQTLLSHACAEMGHDTIYKEPRFKHVDDVHLEGLRDRMDDQHRPILLKLPVGLEQAGHGDEAERHAAAWIVEDSFFRELIRWQAERPSPNIAMFTAAADRARSCGDDDAVVEAANVAARLYESGPDERLISAVFMPVIDRITQGRLPH